MNSYDKILKFHGKKGILAKISLTFKLFVRRIILLKIINLCPFKNLRVGIARLMGLNIGKKVFIGFDCDFDTNFPEFITIKDHVTISHRCMIYAHLNAPTKTRLKKIFPFSVKKVVIEEGAWIAIGSIILPGVKIGREAFVAAGSVVTKDVAPRTLVGGVPAKFIRKL